MVGLEPPPPAPLSKRAVIKKSVRRCDFFSCTPNLANKMLVPSPQRFAPTPGTICYGIRATRPKWKTVSMGVISQHYCTQRKKENTHTRGRSLEYEKVERSYEAVVTFDQSCSV